MKFSCILNCKGKKTCNVCRQWPCNGRREHLKILSDYGRSSPDKGILKKLKEKGRPCPFIHPPTN